MLTRESYLKYMKVELLTKYHSPNNEVRVIHVTSNQDYRWMKCVFLPNTGFRDQNQILGFPKEDKFYDLNLKESN